MISTPDNAEAANAPEPEKKKTKAGKAEAKTKTCKACNGTGYIGTADCGACKN